MADVHPNKAELRVLEVGYNRFLDLYEDVMNDNFRRRRPATRLAMIKDLCSVYSELIKYAPLEYILENAVRPHFKLIGKELVNFLRNLLLHFPYFESWQQIGFDKELITTLKASGSIDKFLTRVHPEELKYRFWEPAKKRMTYIEVHLNTAYSKGEFVWLEEMVPEKDGVKFLAIFMKDVLMTQVETLQKIDK